MIERQGRRVVIKVMDAKVRGFLNCELVVNNVLWALVVYAIVELR